MSILPNSEGAGQDDRTVYISLGAGVQSSALALLAAAGGVGPMPKAAVFADTGDEPASVYRWLDWLEKQLPFPVYRVSDGVLSESATNVRRSGRSGNHYIETAIPVYTTEKFTAESELGPVNGVRKGQGMRHCTRDFKVIPVLRKIRELAQGQPVVQWIGISTDEAHRMKPSRNDWCEHRWPLIDLGMSRTDCLQWMTDAGWPTPPRSACYYCPFHSDREWLRLKQDEPAEFARAVEFERELQAAYARANAIRSVPWLHASRKPLSQVNFNPTAPQPSLFGNECEGMCGV